MEFTTTQKGIIGTALGAAAQIVRGEFVYGNDIQHGLGGNYAWQDALHTALPFMQAPSLTESVAQAPITPDVATTQPIVDVLANFAHSPTQLITAVVLLALAAGGTLFALKAKGDFEQAANNIDTTRRRNPLA